MFDVIKSLAIASLTAFLLSCASTNSSPPPAAKTQDPSGSADSLAMSVYDEYFLDIYGELLEMLEQKQKEDDQNARLIEARSIVNIAEAVYLEGNAILAIKLLNDARLLLRQIP